MTRFDGITSRDRRALGIGLVIVTMSVGYRFSLPAGAALASLRAANQAASDRLGFAREEMSSTRASEDTLVVRRRRLDTADSLLLSSGSPAHVASELGSVLRDAAHSAGLELLGATTQADTLRTAVFQRAEARVEAQGDVSGLMQFLLLVDLSRGLLDVRELSITPAEPAAGRDRAEVLRISMTIEGVARSVTARLPEDSR